MNKHTKTDNLWEKLDSWLESHGWFFVDHSIYTPEEWSDPHPYWGVEIECDTSTNIFTATFGQFVGLENKLKPTAVRFDSIDELAVIIERLRLAIGLIKLAEGSRPCLGVIKGGKS